MKKITLKKKVLLAFLSFFTVVSIYVLYVLHEKNEYRRIYGGHDLWANNIETTRILRSQIWMSYLGKNKLPILGEFPPKSLKSYDYFQQLDLQSLGELGGFPNLYHSNIIISCDFETGHVYAGVSNLNLPGPGKWSRYPPGEHKVKATIERGDYFANVSGDPYAGGDTLLMFVISLNSADRQILRDRYAK